MITNQVKTLHNLIIVDESASMQKVKELIVESLNDTILSIRNSHGKEGENFQKISLVTFNGLGIKMRRFNQWANDVELLGHEEYKPNSTTPMLDCLGTSIGMIRAVHHESERVLVTIISDGVENGSVKYCSKAIKEIITVMKEANWMFNYIGAHSEVGKFCETLNITNYYQINLNKIKRHNIKDRLSIIAKQNGIAPASVMDHAHSEAA